MKSIELLIRRRYPLLLALYVVTWVPLVVLIPLLKPLLANVVLLESSWQLAVFSMASVVAMVFAIAMWRRTTTALVERETAVWKRNSAKWPKWLYYCAVAGAVVSPFSAWLYTQSQAVGPENEDLIGATGLQVRTSMWADLPIAFMAIAGGIGAGGGLLWLAGLVRVRVLGSKKDEHNYFPFETTDQDGWLPLMLANTRWSVQDRQPGVQFGFYFLLLAIGYFLILKPFEATLLPMIAVPTATVLAIWLMMMILARLALGLDSFRIPPLLVLMLLIVTVKLFTTSVSEFKVERRLAEDSVLKPLADTIAEADKNTPRVGETDPPDTALDSTIVSNHDKLKKVDDCAWEAVKQRMNPKVKSDNKTLVVITCPGGGIHAAAWSAFVLEELDKRYPNFSSSTALISSVSGGSVGTYCFLANPTRNKSRNALTPELSTWQHATASSLEAVAAGVLFDDVPKALFPFLPGVGRGQRLEDEIAGRLDKSSATLWQWGESAYKGEMPIVVFNATDIASGRRVLFDTLPTPRRDSLVGNVSRPYNIRELLADPSCDVSVASAVRASATFPYVSPLIQPATRNARGDEVAIADGGYADNEGIVSAIDWIDFLNRKKEDTGEAPFKRILLVRILPSVGNESVTPTKASPIVASLRWLSGPLEALARIRSTSQGERGNLETDLAQVGVRALETVPEPETPLSGIDGDSQIQIEEIKKKIRELNASERFKVVDARKQQQQTNAKVQQRNFSQLRREDEDQRLRDAIQKKGDSGFLKENDFVQNRVVVNQSLPENLANPADNPDDDNADKRPEDDRQVIVVEIPFFSEYSGDAPPLPLNWKLSPRQKLLYALAWENFLKLYPDRISLIDDLFGQRTKKR
ncbi:MAG: patatin-like phospholipase family protein [Pirellulaceae bacterium]